MKLPYQKRRPSTKQKNLAKRSGIVIGILLAIATGTLLVVWAISAFDGGPIYDDACSPIELQRQTSVSSENRCVDCLCLDLSASLAIATRPALMDMTAADIAFKLFFGVLKRLLLFKYACADFRRAITAIATRPASMLPMDMTQRLLHSILLFGVS